jgi:hypothetical protein
MVDKCRVYSEVNEQKFLIYVCVTDDLQNLEVRVFDHYITDSKTFSLSIIKMSVK